LAGALLLGIGRVHPFKEGNRRTALAAANIFLRYNGYMFAAPDGESLGVFVERAITGSISEDTFLQAMQDATVTNEEWDEYQNSKREAQ
jgi:death-on-curing protein